MGKVSKSLLWSVLLFFGETLFGLELKRDQFKHLNLYSKILAEDMISQCSDAISKKELIAVLNTIDSEQEFVEHMKEDKNWLLFKNAFIPLFHSFPCGTKSYLNDEIVARFESEGINLLKLIACPNEGVDDFDLILIPFCLSCVAEKFYNNDINTVVTVNEEIRGTVLDCLDYIIFNTAIGSYRTKLEQLSDVLLKHGVKRS